jgi:hypothetical protein
MDNVCEPLWTVAIARRVIITHVRWFSHPAQGTQSPVKALLEESSRIGALPVHDTCALTIQETTPCQHLHGSNAPNHLPTLTPFLS